MQLIVQSPLQQGLKHPLRMHATKIGEAGLSYKVHYNKDWNKTRLEEENKLRSLIVQSPLQQGLKQYYIHQTIGNKNTYRTKSITTRIETVFTYSLLAFPHQLIVQSPLQQGLKLFEISTIALVSEAYRTKSITTRIETNDVPAFIPTTPTPLSYKVHYNKDWNATLKIPKPSLGILSYKVHYNKDWNSSLPAFLNKIISVLSYKVHYNKDWNKK